jgi:beta-lactamase regulating signal transducer with metallopeptidase domain/biopolymer transport protein ExbD/multidrug resistance efflux pump
MNRITIPLLAALTASLPAMLDSAAKGTALLALIAFLVLFMRKTSAATRHLAWLLGIVGLLLLPLLSAALPDWRVLPTWASVPISTNARIERTNVEPERLEEPLRPSVAAVSSHDTQFSAAIVAEKSTSPANPSQSPSPVTAPRTNVAQWLAATWLVGVTFLLFRMTASAWLLRRSARYAALVTSGPLRQALDTACCELDLRRRVYLLVDERRIIPLVWGVFRARLVLPGEASGWDDSRLRAVLLHELAHIKRGDLPVMLLTHLACALHWFNPLVWLAAWRMHVEREHACDDLVLTAGVKASDYAEHLLHVATRLDTASPAGALAMARPSRLEGRLLAVLNQKLPRGGVPRPIGFLALVLSFGIVIPMAMLRAQEKDATPRDPHEAGSSEVSGNSAVPSTTPGASTSSPAQPADPPTTSPKKVPVLGDIPVMGQLFRSNEKKDVMEIRGDGTILLNATPISYEQLSEKLNALVKTNADHAIVLRAEQTVSYKEIVRLLDASRAAGLKNLSFEVASDPDQKINRPIKKPNLNSTTATNEKLDQAGRRDVQWSNQFRGQQSVHNQDARQALQQAKAQEAGLLASGLGEDHPRVKALRGQIAAYEKIIAEPQSSQESHRSQEVARVQFEHAERELKRLGELEKQKLVSETELDRARAEVGIRKAELIGDALAVARVRLEHAERELQRLAELRKAKLVSDEELDRAKFEVELRKAEMADDRAAAARAKVQHAETAVKRVAELQAQNLVSASESDSRRHELELAQAELKQATSNTPRETMATSSTEILQLFDDDFRLAEKKLAILKRQKELGFVSDLPVLRMQAELVALRRIKAAHEGKQSEVDRLFDEQIKLLEELHPVALRHTGEDGGQKAAIDIQREILALKREKATNTASRASGNKTVPFQTTPRGL